MVNSRCTDLPCLLGETLLADRVVRQIDEEIWSVLPMGCGPASYDRRGAAYDQVVGNALYNRVAWGASTSRYRAFAARAIHSGRGPLLDAGCGSALFTSEGYLQAERPVVLVDRSLEMLAVARRRLSRTVGGTLSSHAVLLQADLLDLPFRPETFGTVLSMGMLHLFEDTIAKTLVRGLLELLPPAGELFLTSLVPERTVGRWYLAMLQRAGEVATPRRVEQLRSMFPAEISETIQFEREGNMAYVVARAGS